jgi:pteridine reductase
MTNRSPMQPAETCAHAAQPYDLKGKTALVTGSVKRVGRGIADALAAEGVNVVVHYRKADEEAEARNACAALEESGVKSWPVVADFEAPGELETLITRAVKLAGRLDILINSASVFIPDTLSDMGRDAFTRHMLINAWAPFYLSREFARLAGPGKIVNLIDSRVTGYDFRHVSYILSKHALLTLTQMTALEFAPGIAVNGVAPGLILPPPGKEHGYLDEMAGIVPLMRHGGTADIADAVIYLLKSGFITGQVINVDGGRHLMEKGNGPHTDK